MDPSALGVATQVLGAPEGPVRARDPARKERILVAAADLVAGHGYHNVSMGAIGAEAGITGPGIYRHFRSKSAVLVALFDRAIDHLVAEARLATSGGEDPGSVLGRLVSGQVEFALSDRELARVYHNEVHNLPDEDRRRLRRKQRLYLEEWVQPLVTLRPELGYAEARTLVHAAVGTIQSTLFHSTALPPDRLRRLLERAASGVLTGG